MSTHHTLWCVGVHWCVRLQDVSGSHGIFQLNLRDMPTEKANVWIRFAEQFQPLATSVQEIEREFWEELMASSHLECSTRRFYASDVPGSLFTAPAGTAGKSVASASSPSSSPSCASSTVHSPSAGAAHAGHSFPWNLRRLDNLLALLDEEIPGVTSPMLYFGVWRSVFGLHTEDKDLFSINYLHQGAPKVWYTIPPDQVHKVPFDSGGVPVSADPTGHKPD